MSQDDFDEVEDEGGGGSPFDLKVLLLYGAWRSKHWIGLCALLGTVGGLMAAASMPNVYQSVAKLDYRPGVSEIMTESQVAGGESLDVRSAPGMANELTLLDELEPYLAVAEDLGPAYILSTPDPTEGDEDADIVTRLWHGFQKTMIGLMHPGFDDSQEVTDKAIRGAAESLKARTNLYVPVRSQTSIITVMHDGFSPERAQKTNQAILKALQNHHLELYSTGDLGLTAAAALSQVEYEISETDSELQQHTTVCGYKNIEAQRDANLELIGEAYKEVSKLETDIAGFVRNVAQIQKNLSEVDQMIERIEPAVMGLSQNYKFENTILFDMRRDRSDMAGTGASNAVLKQLDDKIAEQELKLAAVEKYEEVKPAQRVLIPNDFHTQLSMKRADSETDLERSRGRLEELFKQIKKSEDDVLLMDECRELHKEKVSYLEMKYQERDMARKKLQTTQDQAALEEDGISALLRRTNASMPVMKTGPKRAKPLGMGIMGGLAIGFILAVLRQLLDPTVRYRETVEKELDLSILAVVPESRALRRIKPGHVNVA